MNHLIQAMLQKYTCNTRQDYIHALKEIIQEVALVGLWRSKFFEEAAFYGGTALRILFQLDRFSEDLDFTLVAPRSDYSLKHHLSAIQAELDAFGFHVEALEKVKNNDSAIQSAFLKSNTLKSLVAIGIPAETFADQHRHEMLKIKIEIDTDPPPRFDTCTHYLLQPIPCAIRVVSEPDLFAGKMHAILCRSWKSRVKGRDWYDLVWYVSRKTPLHLEHLEMRMRQSGHYSQSQALNSDQFMTLLNARISEVEFEEAKKDIRPFIREPDRLSVWSPEFFRAIARTIQYT